jgi:hypothetical protein
MNLAYVYQLMNSAHEQRHEVRGSHADREVRLMASAGLVEATLDDGKEGSFTAIDRVTASGHAFLRIFKDVPMPMPIPQFSRLAFGVPQLEV